MTVIRVLTLILLTIATTDCNRGKDRKRDSDGGPSESATGLKDKIIEDDRLIVGFEPDSPPIYFMDDDKPQGFDYELVRFISKKVFENADIEVRESAYDDLPQMLKNGTIHIMAGGRTKEDDEDIIYSNSYLAFGFCIITRRVNKYKYNTLGKLKGKSVGVYDDYAAEWLKENAEEVEVSVIGSDENEDTPESDWMKSLANGEIDAIIYDYPFATNEIEDYGNKLSIAAGNVNGKNLNEYVLGISSENEDAKSLVKQINKAIREYKESNNYSESVTKYIPNPGLEESDEKVPLADGYVIKKGETLSIIAKEFTGDPDKWEELYELNSSVLVSPDIIYPGQQIQIPKNWR